MTDGKVFENFASVSDEFTSAPAEHGQKADDDSSGPGDDDDDDGEPRRAVAAVVVRVADSDVALDGDHEQTEDRDLCQNYDHRVDTQTTVEVGRQTCVSHQNARYTCIHTTINILLIYLC